jgi:hypothetical protein
MMMYGFSEQEILDLEKKNVLSAPSAAEVVETKKKRAAKGYSKL